VTSLTLEECCVVPAVVDSLCIFFLISYIPLSCSIFCFVFVFFSVYLFYIVIVFFENVSIKKKVPAVVCCSIAYLKKCFFKS